MRRLIAKAAAVTMMCGLAMVTGATPAAATSPQSCAVASEGLVGGEVSAMCAEAPTENGAPLPIPPRPEMLYNPGITRGPEVPDPDPNAPDPEPLEDFAEPTPEPVAPPEPPPLTTESCGITGPDPGRFITCGRREMTTVIYRTDSGQIIGRGAHVAMWRTYRVPTRRDWIHEIIVKTTLATGDAALANYRAQIRITTCDMCTVDSATALGPFDIPLNVPVRYLFSIRSDGTSKVNARSKASITITHPRASGSVTVDFGYDKWTRCDSVTYITGQGGCVYPNYVPTFRLPISNPDWNEVASHISDAQLFLPQHYGLQGFGAPLNRITDKGWMRLNRRVACYSVPTTPGVTSCDEYPFASTRQGAAFVGANNSSSRAVDKNDNERAGSQLSKFYSNFRILAGERFWVDTSG